MMRQMINRITLWRMKSKGRVRISQFVPLIFLCFGLAGCASYQAEPINPARSALALEAGSLNDPGLQKFLQNADPTGHGWTLSRLTLAGLYERPDILIAEDQKLMAEGAVQKEGTLPNPTLSLTPTYNATNLMPSPWKVGPIFSFMLNSLVTRPALLQAARAHLAAAQQALPIAAWQIRSQVRSAMLNLWTAQKLANLDAQSLNLTQQSEAAIIARVNAGQMSGADENNAILATDQSALTAAAATRQVGLSLAALATAIGLPPDSLNSVNINFNDFVQPVLPTNVMILQQVALTSRPDIQVALDNYAAAEARLRLTILQQYPGISVGPGYEYDQGANKYQLSLSINLPIFNQNQGAIASAYAARALSAAKFLSIQQSALNGIENAMANIQLSGSEVLAADALLQNVHDKQTRLTQQYHDGAIGKLRLIGGHEALIQSELGAVEATQHRDEAIGALEDSLYHPFFGVEPRS